MFHKRHQPLVTYLIPLQTSWLIPSATDLHARDESLWDITAEETAHHIRVVETSLFTINAPQCGTFHYANAEKKRLLSAGEITGRCIVGIPLSHSHLDVVVPLGRFHLMFTLPLLPACAREVRWVLRSFFIVFHFICLEVLQNSNPSWHL